MANSAPIDVEKLLATLRDAPVDNTGASEAVLIKIYLYLMEIPTRPPDGVLHWFCSRASPTTVAAATFMLRLFAYNSPQVDAWKVKFQSCIGRCVDCVQGLEYEKEASKITYFGAFSEDILKGFYESFEKWELEMVLNDLTAEGITDSADASSARSLADAPSAALYRMVCNWTVFSDPRIQSILRHTRPPCDPISGWPSDPLPPGMFVLFMHENPNVRHWARNQASKCTNVPMSSVKFSTSHRSAVEAMTHALSTSGANDSSPSLLSNHNLIGNSPVSFSFASDASEFWSGFCAALRLIPLDLLTSSKRQHVDFRRVITGHLHDNGPQFTEILRGLLFLMKRMGEKFWLGEGPEYPVVVFDTVKDNPAFLRVIQDLDPSAERPWYLAWFPEFLHTLRDFPVYGDILAKIADLLCEELQHERFKDARPVVMASATRMFSSLIRKCQVESVYTHKDAVYGALDIHSETLIAVAFARSFDGLKWKDARTYARQLFKIALSLDIQDVLAVIHELCKLLVHAQSGRVREGRTDVGIPTLSIRKQMWKKSYEALQTNDAEGLVIIISIVAQSAHIDPLNTKPFSLISHIPNPGKSYTNGESILNEINRSLHVMWDGFKKIMTDYANYNDSSSALDVLRRPGVVKDIMILMLSPIESIQVAAQALVGLAFDVDGRLDCFRALLENLPDAALEGIFEFLSTFVHYSPIVPEACNLSKSLVRCFTDIIEVLCASPDGLLHSSRFLRPADDKGPASELPKLWTLMTKSITVIFKRTPLWSTYFQNEDMIVWMRDALIFGRDMLAQWRVIETAASSRSPPTKGRGKLSSIGKKMVNDLQLVLPELARWLRLTDEELLHQSFSLLQSLLDCFRETGIQPSEAGMSKLTKHIENARKDDPAHPKTRLDSTRLSKLEVALASFEEDDDEVEIISYNIAPKKPIISIKEPSKPKVESRLHSVGGKLAFDKSKPAVKLPPPARASSSKSSSSASSHYFTADDQQQLDSIKSLPTFHKSAQAPVLTPSASKLPGQSVVKRRNTGPKNEGLAQRAAPETSDSSDSESDDDDAPPEAGLASLVKFQRSPKIKKPVERRQIKTLDIPTQKNAMQERLIRRDEARRTALRLKPNLSGLHKALLSWDYNHDGSEPPGDKVQRIRVPDKFVDYDEYRRVFEPLLLLECWSQIVQSKEEVPESYECKISSRQFSNEWLDLDVTFPGNLNKGWYLAETDVVLMRHLDGKKCILAKTQSYRHSPQTIQGSIRCSIHAGNTDIGLEIGTTWRLSKAFSLSTLHREYAALLSLPYYDLCSTILQPSLPKVSKADSREIQQAMATYSVNEPQAAAITNSLQTEGFALIQGPPGTGKTSTICGLVAAFLAGRSRPAVAVHAGRNATAADRAPMPKVLLCAPSNAAIDEIAYRIKEGFRGAEKRPGAAKVVRLGTEKSMNISVRDISLDYLVDQKLDSGQKSSKETGNEIMALRRELDSVKELRHQKLQELSTIHDNAAKSLALEEEMKRLNSQRMALNQQFDRLKDKQKSDNRTLDAVRRRARVEVLQEADVICSTLSGAGHEILEQYDFEMVIIDEAAQAIELSTLIPLKYRCVRCVMVGDPQQLPPTVLSQEACRFQYNQSLFVRLQKHRPDAVHLLSIQYRMHPEISRLPSRVFYQGRLQDGPGMDVKTKQPWHSHPKFGTYRFYNVVRGLEDNGGRSIKNVAECQMAVALYARIRQEFSSFDFDFRVGVVSMYRAQIVELRRQFEYRFGHDIVDKVDFNTVDGFQGQEKDIIILSCVRAGPGLQSVGFLSDVRRMNVALTRAKSSLFILGNAPTLERSDATWRDIVLDARTRSLLMDTETTYFTSPTETTHRPPPLPRKLKPPYAAPESMPPDLATPRDLKVAMSQKPGPTSSRPPQEPLDEPSPLVSAPPLGLVGGSSNKPTEELDSDKPTMQPPQPPRPPAADANTRPRAPSMKRPKQPKQPNLFIPKNKNNKRPAEDSSAGPSSIRRRL